MLQLDIFKQQQIAANTWLYLHFPSSIWASPFSSKQNMVIISSFGIAMLSQSFRSKYTVVENIALTFSVIIVCESNSIIFH